MIIMRGIALLFLVIGGALLALGLGGFADDWIDSNVSCGDSYSSRPCEPGEAQGVLTLVGGIFAGVALLLLVASFWLGRAMQPLTALSSSATQSWPLTSPAIGAQPPSPTAPTAPVTAAAGADPLVDRLARLADLRDRGVLTEAEFQAQKAKLLLLAGDRDRHLHLLVEGADDLVGPGLGQLALEVAAGRRVGRRTS